MIAVFMASHLTPYRLFTAKQAIQSVADAAIVEVQHVGILKVYWSYSYENEIVSKLEEFETICKETCAQSLSITFYRHNERRSQFEHLEYIFHRANDVDWIMFQDDDDISMVNRLTLFFSVVKQTTVSVISNTYRFERGSTIPKPPYGSHANFYNRKKVSISRSDFATGFVRTNVLESFLRSRKERSKYTDCLFSEHLQILGNQVIIDEPVYAIRQRLWTTDEEFFKKLE